MQKKIFNDLIFPILLIIFSLIWWGSHLWAYWPGLYSYDGLLYVDSFAKQVVSSCYVTWESYLYSCLNYLSYRYTNDLSLFLIGQIVFSTGVIIQGYFVLSRYFASKKVAFYLMALTIALPAVGYSLVFTERDILYGWLLFSAILQVLDLSTNKSKNFYLKFAVLLFTVLMASIVRKEATLLIGLVPLAFAYLLKRDFFKVVIFSTIFTICFGTIFLKVIPGSFEIYLQQGLDDRYNLNAFLSPLTDILTSDKAKISEDEYTYFQKALDFSILYESKKTGGLPVNAVKNGLSPEEFRTFTLKSISLIIKNINIYIENRIEIIGRVKPNKGEKFHYSELDVNLAKNFQSVRTYLNDKKSSSNFYLRYYLDKLQSQFDTKEYLRMAWNPLLGSFLVIALLVFSIFRKYIFYLILIPICQTVVFILFSSAPKIKYIYVDYLVIPLFGWVLVSEFIHINYFKGRFLVGDRLRFSFQGKIDKYKGLFKKNVDLWISNKNQIDSKFKNMLTFFLKLSVGMSCLSIVYYFDGAISLSFKIDIYRALPVFLLAQLLTTYISSLRWNEFQKKYFRPMGTLRLFLLSWASQGVGLFSFGIIGADLFKSLFLLKRHNIPASATFKIVLFDRLSSFVGALIICVAIFTSNYVGLLGPVIAMSPFLVFEKHFSRACFMSLINHLIKAFSILFAVNGSLFSFEGLRDINGTLWTLLIEGLPISIDGLGIGHLGARFLIDNIIYMKTYHEYFLVKLSFKVVGLLILLFFFSKVFRSESSKEMES